MDGDVTVTRPHRFTVADYYRMAEVGIFNEDSRVELIRGQIVDMPPVGAPHFAAVNRLNRLLVQAVDDRAIVSVRNPVRLDDGSEPGPDIALLRPRADEYAAAIAGANDVLLIVEVADSSLRDDRAVKAPLYAEGGIPKCWIVNLVERVVEVHRQPSGGRYAQTRRVGAGDTLPILGLGDSVGIPAAEILRSLARMNLWQNSRIAWIGRRHGRPGAATHMPWRGRIAGQAGPRRSTGFGSPLRTPARRAVRYPTPRALPRG